MSLNASTESGAGVDNITLNFVLRTMARAQAKAGDQERAEAILDDMPRAQLNDRYCEMVKEFVGNLGGGLVVIAGPRFGPRELLLHKQQVTLLLDSAPVCYVVLDADEVDHLAPAVRHGRDRHLVPVRGAVPPVVEQHLRRGDRRELGARPGVAALEPDIGAVRPAHRRAVLAAPRR